ncbi:amidohydrolase family protein [Myxococcota bacterium]|nr:amidohydrolase family protein [Myxococcota bacterium]
MHFDTVFTDATVFDGTGGPRRRAHVGLRDGRIASISPGPLPADPGTEVVDATDLWLTPGFIDFHTHYDVEVELSPGLDESLRHGVTTVTLGSCSLSAALGEPEDIADIFCRVEAVPREVVLPLLRERKTWEGYPAYLDHLDTLPLGPNVTSFVGHSNLRMHTLGFARSVDSAVRATPDELARMERLLAEGLDAGCLGLSIQTLPWDKLDGSRQRSKPLPSYFAPWSEYRRLTRLLRDRGRVFQGVPNITTKVNVLLFLWESAGLCRRALKTTVISLMDIRANRHIWWQVPLLTRLFNRFLGADFRMQALPNLFDVWADGVELVIFEELGCGTEALHLTDPAARVALFRDPAYRARFRREWRSLLAPRVYHRNMAYTQVLACPEPGLAGRSFAEIAAERGQDAVDTFLDLVATHGPALRWYSIMANDRPGPLQAIVSHPDVLIGFSDAGAHLRQMAHYNFPLRLLKLVRDAETAGRPFMSLERAVHRLTGEIGDWFGLDAGTLREGARADLVLVRPDGLDDAVETAVEAPMHGFPGLDRLVRRNPRAVPGVWVNGRRAVADGEVLSTVGREAGFGRVLRAGA